MENITYPTLRVTVLQGLRELKDHFNSDPKVLQSGNCPYDAETIAILTQILTTRVEVRTVEVAAPAAAEDVRGGLLDDEEKELVNKTISELLRDLNKLGEGESNLDTATKVAIIKAKATLIDQLLKQHERVMNVKRIAEFQSIVMAILDDLVSDEGRQQFLKRIEMYND